MEEEQQETAAKECPRCGNSAEAFQPVDTSLKVALESTGRAENLPGVVCTNCYAELTSSVSQGMKLRLEAEQREKNKMVLWKNRVNLIKQARQHMIHKAYSEAAISYEKYLRVLELVYNKKKGELTPEIFNNSKRSKELTVVASVYWDLMRIYDTSPHYTERMRESAQKLTEFLQYSTLHQDILRKAESFLRAAKNPAVVRSFLTASKGRTGKCFVATAAFGTAFTPELDILRGFRDETLKQFPLGRKFVKAYYRTSPPLAKWLEKQGWVKPPARVAFRLLAVTLKNHVEKRRKLRDLKGHVAP